MDRETLLQFRDLLQNQLEQLSIRRTRQVMELEDHIDDRNPKDEADMVTSRAAREWAYRMDNRKSLLQREIRAALQRIHVGNFGVCSRCADDVDIERLRANPWTGLCIGCQRSQEAAARRCVA
jgi:DnaK suppressor protein